MSFLSIFGLGETVKPTVYEPDLAEFEDDAAGNTSWREPLGLYYQDVDAFKRYNKYLKVAIFILQIISFVLAVLLFLLTAYLILFGNFETVIFDDGSRLFCTVLEDGTVGIAY